MLRPKGWWARAPFPLPIFGHELQSNYPSNISRLINTKIMTCETILRVIKSI